MSNRVFEPFKFRNWIIFFIFSSKSNIKFVLHEKKYDALYKLVHSMSKTEKGYFKKQAKAFEHSGSANYIKLFNAIDKQAEYDEAELMKRFEKGEWGKSFRVAQNYLFNTILKNLNAFYANKSPKHQINQLLENHVFLANRNLMPEAEKLLRKAKNIAKKHEYFYKWREIIRAYRLLLKDNYDKRSTSTLRGLETEMAEVDDLIENLEKYGELRSTVFRHVKNNETVRTEKDVSAMEALMKSPLLQSDDYAKSFNAKALYYETHYLHACLLNDDEKAYKHSKANFEYWNKATQLQKNNLMRYMLVMHQYMNGLFHMNRFDDVAKAIEVLGVLKCQTAHEQLRKFELMCQWFQLYCLTSARPEAYEQHERYVLDGLKQYANKISKDMLMTLCMNHAIIYFLLDDFEAALLWNNRALEVKLDKKVQQHFRHHIIRVNLIIHYELGNYLALPSYIKSAERYFKQLQGNHRLEKALFKLLRTLAKQTDKQKSRLLFQNFMAYCQELENDPNEVQALHGLFSYEYWAKSKVEQTSLLALYKTWYAQNHPPSKNT